MSRSRESRPRGSRKQLTKITYAGLASHAVVFRGARISSLGKNYHGAQGFALLAHFLLITGKPAQTLFSPSTHSYVIIEQKKMFFLAVLMFLFLSIERLLKVL